MRTSAQVSSLRIFQAILVLIMVTDVSAFNTDTHQLLNDRAAAVSKLSDYLTEQLGLTLGLEETVAGRLVREWIQRGGLAEDEFLGSETLGALIRSRHHFHNPLLPWNQAGLDALSPCPPFILRGEASVRWAQNPDQGISGKASWADARREFLRALTLPSKAGPDTENREIALARTFQILGQQMHLIADLAVPAHTRNDPHCPPPDGFEAWASRRDNASFIGSLLAGQPKAPDEGIFKLGVPIDESVARVPIARLWDTDQYNPLNPNPAITLSPTIGLAEYTNANFFSDDTVFRRFPFPAATSVELGPPEPEPKTGERRRYFKKVRDGEGIDHLAVPSALYEFLPDALKDKKIGLDDTVFKDYAAKLLPRAVGYSAALLNYFFRGTLDFTIGGSSPNQTLIITNKSDEAMEGTFTLYADNFSDTRSAVAGASFSLNLGPGATSGALNFTPPAEAQAYTLVFQGRLGLEEGVIAGKVNDWYSVSEVTPGTITAGQTTTLKITVKSNFTRQSRTLTAALVDANANRLASAEATIPNSGPVTTIISLEVTPNTIPSSAPSPISLVVASDADISSITQTDLANRAPVGAMNLVRVGETSRLPIYQRVMKHNLMYVLSSSTGHSGRLWWLESSTEPFMITWKFKNAPAITVRVTPRNAEGDFRDGKMQQREFSGTQVDFSSFTISYAEPGKDTVSSFLEIEGGVIDGFICILDVEIAGRSVLRNPFSIGGFLFTECPE